MAVTKNSDGTYEAGGMTFATAEEAFAWDASRHPDASAATDIPTPPSASKASIRTEGDRARGPYRAYLPWGAALLLAAFAAALYFSPHWALYRMRAAIEARDAAAFSSRVDFPALKEDVKGQLLTQMSGAMQTEGVKDNPLAGFGKMIAMGLVNQMVEAFVSPAGVMMMMSEGRPVIEKDGRAARPPVSASEEKKAPPYAIDYRDWSTVVLRGSEPPGGGAFILKRQGLFSWKLAAIELPR